MPETVNGCVPSTAVKVGIPVQVVAGTVGLAITMPAGKVSVKESPALTMLPAAVLVSVKVKLVVWPIPMLDAPKAFVKVGSGLTVRFAMFEAAPVLACVDDTPDVVLGCTPTTLLFTVTVTVQLRFGGIVSAVNESEVWLFVKLLVPAPAQIPSADWLALIVIFANVSVNPAAVRLIELGLNNVNVIVLVLMLSESIAAGPNALAMVGDPAVTMRFAVFETAPVIASGPVTDTVEVVFGRVPGVSLVTNNVIVHVPLWNVRAVKFNTPVCWSTNVLPATPPHVPPAF